MEVSKLNTDSIHLQFPTRTIIAFARRWDYDGVVCLVLSDPVYRRGQVLIVHGDAPAGHEIDDEFSSWDAWAKAAGQEIDERIRMGWNESIKHLLD